MKKEKLKRKNILIALVLLAALYLIYIFAEAFRAVEIPERRGITSGRFCYAPAQPSLNASTAISQYRAKI